MTETSEAVKIYNQPEYASKHSRPYVLVTGTMPVLEAAVADFIRSDYQPIGGPLLLTAYDHENHPIFAQALIHISIARRAQ